MCQFVKIRDFEADVEIEMKQKFSLPLPLTKYKENDMIIEENTYNQSIGSSILFKTKFN